MNRILIAAAALLTAASAWAADPVFYRIETAPSGAMVAADLPVLKGNTYLFHGYPSGNLVSLRRSDVKRIFQITSAAATGTNPSDRVIQIGNLAMQGGSTQAGAANANAVRKPSGPEIGKGFYGNVVPGVSEGMPNSANDYTVGKTFAAPPGNAVVAGSGGVPMMPSNPQ